MNHRVYAWIPGDQTGMLPATMVNTEPAVSRYRT